MYFNDSINKRIEILYDREHTIGHAFFMRLLSSPKIEVLKDIYTKSIIPLLQEYFYDDYSKIKMVLGNDFIIKKKIDKEVFNQIGLDKEDLDFDDILDRQYEVNFNKDENEKDVFDYIENYIKIYRNE